MRGYTQLPQEQRYQIQTPLNTGQNQLQIATVVDVHKTTISRELRRNRDLRGHQHHQAYRLARVLIISELIARMVNKLEPPALIGITK